MIRSTEGTHQGDPASGLFLALAIHPTVRRVTRNATWSCIDGMQTTV